MGKEDRIKAVSLFSGGLDSLLSIHLMMEQNIEVIPLHFYTAFAGRKDKAFIDKAKNEYLIPEPVIIDVSEEFLEVLLNPKYGYGCNLNPCIDCKIFFFKKAKEKMEELGAQFIISGEVLDQRPMSQRRETMIKIEKEAGVSNLVVRPLCGKLLPPTIPEKLGMIERDKLLAIRGRGRKVQFELAKKYNIKSIPTPAGGCLLTDPGFSARLLRLIEIVKKPSLHEIKAIKIGRIFDLGETLLIVSRNEKEAEIIEREYQKTMVKLKNGYIRGIIIGEYTGKEKIIGGIIARYERVKSGTLEIAGKSIEVEALPEER
ncbi:MAG: tRNA 4-thiouridine(8) synthase ThiI, partial [candidate division WOR-3 bacterium]